MLDYKKIVKKRSTRVRILRMLDFVPDRLMLKIQYLIKTGNQLNLKNPKRFTEKLQWYKLYYRDPMMIKCVDKYDVRDYVISKGLEEILVPCYGVYNGVDEINWNVIPTSFVMKDTLGGGGTSVVVVRDKNTEDIEHLKAQAKHWTLQSIHTKGSGREWPYYGGKNHRIIFEQNIEPYKDGTGLIDYKFFCFDGKVEFIYVMGEREIGKSVQVSIFDRDFNRLPVLREGDAEYKNARKPDHFESMITIAERLSADFPHVRVDLYNINGQIYFGELTFFNASGYMRYNPDSFDTDIGNKWKLPQRYDLKL